MSPDDRAIDPRRMWVVTTQGDLPDDSEERQHDASMSAWADYSGRILEFEIGGFTRDGEEATEYGRRWVSRLSRGLEHIRVSIERTG